MAKRLLVRCAYVNLDRGGVYGEDPEYVEAFTDDRGELFRSCRSEHGRCVSTMRNERDGDRPCGWVFQKRERYSDSGRGGRRPESYLRETWVYVREERVPAGPSEVLGLLTDGLDVGAGLAPG